MESFFPYLNFYPQLWMLPNGMITRSPYFPQVPLYPQMGQIQTMPTFTNSQCNKTIGVSPTQLLTVPAQKESWNNQKSKLEHEKITVILDSNSCSESKIKVDSKKVQRPQKYLTEKAYYMKQKLKGKQKIETRVLRRRLKLKEKKKEQAICPLKHIKKEADIAIIKQKPMPIMKDSEKEKKILNEIKEKLCHEYRNEYAEIPVEISGMGELNEFCRVKLLSLLGRKFKSVEGI